MSKMVFRKATPEDLRPGAYKLFAKTLSDTDAMLYAGVSGEVSPLYLNRSFAEEAELEERVVPPMLVAGLAGGAIYRLLPPAVRTESREFRFLRPVYVGDTVTARAEIREADLASGRIEVAVSCYNQQEEQVMEGTCREVLVLWKNEEA